MRAPISRAQQRPAVPERLGARRRRLPRLRLQGGRRDRRARRQHRGAARRRSPTTVCCASRCRSPTPGVTVLGHTRWASVGIISEANCHPLNSDELEPSRRRAVRRRRAQRRRRQPRRPQGRPRACASPGRSPPTPRSSRARDRPPRRSPPAWRSSVEAFRRTVAEFEGSVAIGAARADRPRPAAARAARQRSGAVRRPGRRLLHRRQRAVRRRRGDQPLPAHRRRDAVAVGQPRPGRSCSTRARAGDARRHRAGSPTTAAELPRRRATTSPPPRSPPATSTAATPRTSCSRRSARRPTASARRCAARSSSATALLRAAVGARALPADVAARLADGDDHAGCASSARAPPRSPGAAWPALLDELADGAARRRGRSPPPSCRGFGLRLDMSDTLVVAVSQSGTTTDTNRTVDLLARPRRGGDRHRQPAQQRPHRQGRRRAVHVRRARRGDERRLHQGVLRPGRRRRAAGLRDHRGGRASASDQRRARAARVAARAARRDARGAGPPRGDRRRRPAVRAAEALLGDRRQRRRTRVAAEEVRIKLSELCYKSIACDVTEDKKHIDLSSRAADPRVRGRPRRVAPPTTSPRRSRSSGPTRRRRS